MVNGLLLLKRKAKIWKPKGRLEEYLAVFREFYGDNRTGKKCTTRMILNEISIIHTSAENFRTMLQSHKPR
jgi:hypothetical protein